MQVVTGPKDLLERSAKMKTKKGGNESGSSDEEKYIKEMIEESDEKNEVIFAEYVFLMRAGALSQFLPGGWRERAQDMTKLREGFDAADVDGNNELELEELEMVIMSMNPKANVELSGIRRVWAVLNPSGKEWIPFSEYAAGMMQVKRDPELSKLVPMDVPNRFQLLSLLIDSPINEDQEKLIFDKMDPLEQMGVKMLKKMKQEEQTRAQIRETLDQA